ncbi:hypothetical protein [Bacillus massilinigeriensis]|uniref:hypothetical protein n=1 Tax=Bacillus massilionigeriensis TaxID=1805475 RepID=UPI00096B0E74|nr:hypothetical protein [Bacillus massilionigeriensis]
MILGEITFFVPLALEYVGAIAGMIYLGLVIFVVISVVVYTFILNGALRWRYRTYLERSGMYGILIIKVPLYDSLYTL